jgi:hypothetical protein
MPTLPPELLQSIERGTTSAPGQQPASQAQQKTARAPVNGHAAPPAQRRTADQAAEVQRQKIVAPLSEALARAVNSDPTTGRPVAPTQPRPPANGIPPLPSEPVRGNGTPPPVNSAPQVQPDFSTLPPSIAKSLARLAGGSAPLSGEGAKGDAPRPEQKIASKG